MRISFFAFFGFCLDKQREFCYNELTRNVYIL